MADKHNGNGAARDPIVEVEFPCSMLVAPGRKCGRAGKRIALVLGEDLKTRPETVPREREPFMWKAYLHASACAQHQVTGQAAWDLIVAPLWDAQLVPGFKLFSGGARPLERRALIYYLAPHEELMPIAPTEYHHYFGL